MRHETPHRTAVQRRRRVLLWAAAQAEAPTPTPVSAAAPGALDAGAAARFAALALKCLHQEYPNHVSHTLDDDADVRPPHALTPAFYGCFDWHSDVHGHWLLVRLRAAVPGGAIRRPGTRATRAAASPPPTSPANSPTCRARAAPRSNAPTGSRGCLQLAAELRAWNDPQAQAWLATLRAAGERGGRAAQELAAEAALPDPYR